MHLRFTDESVRISVNKPGMTQTSRQGSSLVMIVIFTAMTQRPNSSLRSGEPAVSQTKDSTSDQERNQEHANGFLVGLCTMNSDHLLLEALSANTNQGVY